MCFFLASSPPNCTGYCSNVFHEDEGRIFEIDLSSELFNIVSTITGMMTTMATDSNVFWDRLKTTNQVAILVSSLCLLLPGPNKIMHGFRGCI